MYSEEHRKEKQREAQKRYREKNREKVREQDRIAQAARHKRLKDDPEYLAMKRKSGREYQQRRRQDPDEREKDRTISREYQRDLRAKDPKAFNEKSRNYMRPKYSELRNQVHKKLGNKCAKCGYDEDTRGIQIDHIKGGGRGEHNKLGWYKYFQKILRDQTDYQLLCATCNYIKRYTNKEIHIVDPILM